MIKTQKLKKKKIYLQVIKYLSESTYNNKYNNLDSFFFNSIKLKKSINYYKG